MSSQSITITAKFLAVSILALGLASGANAQGGFFKKPAPPALPAAAPAPVAPASAPAPVAAPTPASVAVESPVATPQTNAASTPAPKKDATEPVQAAKPVPAVKARVTPAPVPKPATENSTANTSTNKIVDKSLTPTPAQAAAASIPARQVAASDASIRQLGDIENTMQTALRALRSGTQN